MNEVKRCFCYLLNNNSILHRSTAKRWSTSVPSPPWTARRPWGAGSRFASPTSGHGRPDLNTDLQGRLTTGRFTIHLRSMVIPETSRYEQDQWFSTGPLQHTFGPPKPGSQFYVGRQSFFTQKSRVATFHKLRITVLDDDIPLINDWNRYIFICQAALVLKDSDSTRSLWNHKFEFLYTITLKEKSLQVSKRQPHVIWTLFHLAVLQGLLWWKLVTSFFAFQLEVEVLNKGPETLDLTFCFHTYFNVPDVRKCALYNFQG